MEQRNKFSTLDLWTNQKSWRWFLYHQTTRWTWLWYFDMESWLVSDTK